MPLEINAEEFISVKGFKALGNQLTDKKIKLIELKDTGKIIPGHGGLLDRVDGMIFAFPFSYLVLLIDIL